MDTISETKDILGFQIVWLFSRGPGFKIAFDYSLGILGFQIVSWVFTPGITPNSITVFKLSLTIKFLVFWVFKLSLTTVYTPEIPVILGYRQFPAKKFASKLAKLPIEILVDAINKRKQVGISYNLL